MNGYLKAMLTIEEIFIKIDECENLFNDLDMWHFDQSFQNIEEIHIVYTILKIAMIIQTNLRIGK